MFNYKATLQALMRERASRQAEIDKLGQVIDALESLAGNASPARTAPRMSAQARRRISQAQKKRWAMVKQGIGVNAKRTKKAKGKISAEGLQNIIDAQNRRWAKVRAAAKAKARGVSGKKATAK